MNYPLIFTYNGSTIGKGFVAHIELCGRLLANVEADGVWINGVHPGSLADNGKTIDEAHANIREMVRRVFIDFATAAVSFEVFKAEVEAFFQATDIESADEWREAVEAVRAAHISVMGLKKRPAETELFVRVTELHVQELTPTLNATESEIAETGVTEKVA